MHHLLSFKLFENKTNIFNGYKIVAYDGIRYYSLYSKETLNLIIGKTISFGGEGLFIGGAGATHPRRRQETQNGRIENPPARCEEIGSFTLG